MPRKVMEGIVVSDKMQNTVVVKVIKSSRHRLYDKVLRHSSKYLAHDEEGASKEGDLVRIEECRPMSRLKRWRVIEVVRGA